MSNTSFNFAELMRCGKKPIFKWKISDFTKRIQHWSSQLHINGYFCRLAAGCCFDSDEKIWLFSLYAPGINCYNSFYPVYYTMSVVDRGGHDFIKHVGKIERKIWEKNGILMTLDESYLKENNLIQAGAIEMHFILECGKQTSQNEQNLQPTECSSTVLERSTQTETSQLQPSRDICTNTEEEPAKLLETLSKDFCSFYESKRNTDCVLRVGEAQFPVHRAVLSARSSVFSAMFHHDTTENRGGVVDIPDVEATILSEVLHYMYSGKIQGLTAETATALYAISDKYALIELRNESLNFLMWNLTMDNVCDAAVLAHTHGEVDLEQRILQFIEHRLEDIIESNQWREFSTVKPLLANRLLGLAFVSCKKKLVSERA